MSQGYGADTWCLDSLQPGRYATGATVVVQALYRRLITPRGTLQPVDDTLGGDDERAYGFDVSGYCGAVGYPTAVNALPGQVRNELLKDDRVSPSLSVTATLSQGNDGLDAIDLSISGELADESGSFDLTLRVNDVTVAILGGVS
jgi:hypothetical protein